METSAERRRRKLKELCTKYGLREVARRSGTNPAALDQVVKGVLLPPKADGSRSPRSLGDTAARAIEKAFDRPEGWMDASDDIPLTLSQEALQVAQAYDKMTPRERQKLDHLMAVALDLDLGELELRERNLESGLGDLGEDTGTG